METVLLVVLLTQRRKMEDGERGSTKLGVGRLLNIYVSRIR